VNLGNLGSDVHIRDFRVNGLSAAGRDWLTAALDPFHDKALSRTGLPDRYAGSSIVEIVTESITLSAPTGTTGNWSAHIFSLPFSGTVTTYPTSLVTTRYSPAAMKLDGTVVAGNSTVENAQSLYDQASQQLGLLNVWAWDSEPTSFFPSGSQLYSTVKPTSTYALNASISGQARIIGGGVEIVNTTADLYKQGTVTCSRVPNSIVDVAFVSCAGDTNLGANVDPNVWTYGALYNPGIRACYGPPATIAAAMNFPSSKQWAAAEGCYSVFSFDVEEADMRPVSEHYRAVLSSFDPVEQTVAHNSPITSANGYAAPTSLVTASGTDKFICPGASQTSIDAPMDTSSIILTGLSKESTFTITLRYIVERAPRYGDASGGTLVRLMSPSPAYDPVALELYKEVMGKLLPGVPSKYNPMGEFFRYVRDLVQKAAPVVAGVASMIPHPAAQAIGRAAAAVTTATKVLNTVNSARKAIQAKKRPAPKKAAKRK
jgi:hypothetical protein